MAKKWSDVAASTAFQALSLDQQEEARQQYFEDVVAPQVPEEDLDVARSQFYADTQKTLSRAADTGDESARLAARYPAPKQPGLLDRAASAISSVLPKPVDPMGIASGKPLANEPIAPQAPAPKQREVAPYRNRTEALDDAVNLLEEGADKDVVRSSFEKGGIKFSEIVAHGKKRGSDYFKQETIPKAEARTTFIEPTGEIKPIETSLVDDAINLGRRVAARSSQSFTNTLFQAGIIGEDAAAQQFAKDQKKIEGAAPPESIQEGMQAIGSSKTYGDAALNLASNPAATFTMLTESLLQSAPQLALAVSRLPMAARVVGTGAFSGAMEFGGTMADVLADRGVDMTNAAAVSDAINNPEVRDAIREKGAARGLTIGVIDALTAGFAGKFLEPVQSSIRAGKLAEQAARRATIGAWSKELGLQIAGGSGGEALAQTITGENKPADVLLEGLAEGFGAPLEARANLRESSDLMPSAQISRAIDEAVAGGQWTTSAQQEAAARLDPNSYDPTLVSPLETSKPVAPAPISIVNFTEPGSATAQAGLTPIVVPIPERTAPSVPTDVQVNPETEREFGLDKLRMGGGNVGTAGGVLSATAAGGQPAGDLGGAGLGNAGIAGVDTTRPAGTGPNGLVPVGGETAPAGGAGSQPATPLTQPTEQWFGRRGDGYQTESDATQALGGRKRMFPGLDWKIELMPNGKYRLAGYNLETASGTQAPQAQQAQAQGAQAGQLPAVGTAAVPGAAAAGTVQAPQLPGPLPEGLKLAPTAPMGVIKSVRNQLIRDDQLEVATVSQAEMTDQQKLASMVARLTGKTLTVIKYASGNRDAMPNAFIDQLGGKHIFVADDSNDAPLFVAVHEAYHGLPEEKRQVLNTALLDLFRQDKKGEFLTEFNYQEKDFNEEAPAFMVQALSKRPEFWNDVRQKLGNKEFAEVAKVIINKFQEILTGANKAYGEDFVNKYISDVKKAHDLLTTAYADAMREQGFTPDIETTGKIAASNRVVEQAPAPKFYSQLQRSFEQVPERIATQPASQWKVWLTSNAPKLGVKKDEIEWSGINDYLEMRGRDKVSKAEISDYLANNGVKVEEVQLKESDKSTPRPKYAGYTLDGGGNYREVLLKLPEAQKKETWEWYDPDTGESGQGFATQQEAYDARPNIGAVVSKVEAKDSPQNYRSAHWDEPNVLAHIRITDRTSPDKKKVLFVEEIQSDWGQEGKKKGFQGSKQFTVRPDTSGKEALAGRWEVVDQDGNIEEGFRTEAEANKWANIEQQGQGVPAAPFVSKRGEAGKYRDNTEGWLNLALKRIAMMAVEGGYDRVAFVNGEQSADRYDLSKSVQSLSYKPLSEDLGLLEAWSPDRDQVIRERVSPDKVEDYVGKEVAQRLLATEPVMGKHLLDGEDLKVGGEGMKTFYDQIVPQAINKLMPKLGAGKLATTDINTVDGRDDIEVSRYDVMDDLEIPAERQDDYWYNLTPIERNDLTNDYRRRNPVLVPTSQPGFEVTDAMRAAVSAGLPMFSKRAQGEDIGAKLQQRVDSDFEGASQEYSQLNGTKGGRVLDTDIARELSPEYKQDRTRSAEVHEAASDFIQREYERRIATAEPGGEVVFMAGGGGSGKSSAESLLAPVLEGAHTVYDGTLSSYDKAERNIQMALDAGQLVNVAYVYREPEEAFRNGVLTRAMRKGRTVPIDALVKGHAGSSETVRRLQEKFGDNPRFSIKAVDNSRGPGKAVVTDLASITPVIKSGLKERFENAARQEYEAGRISDAVYRGTTGRAADAGAGSQSSRADGRVRSEVPGSVQERAGSEQSGNPVTKDEAVVDGVRYSARSRNLVDIPTIEIKDLVDKKVVGIKADLTDAGRSYTGIDGSQLEFPIEMMGGPNFVRLPENFQANVIWAVRGGATLSKILTQVKKADYVLVHAMNGNSHLTNSTISTAYLQTVEAYLRDGRISKDNLKALDEIVRSPKNKSSLPDFPGFESPEIYSYIDSLSFDQRGALAQILEKKEAQVHGLPNLERFRRETIDPDFAGYRQGDAMLVLKVDKENPTVKLGEEGTKLHPSYPLGLRGKVIGKLAKGINYEVIFRDYFKFAVPNFKNGTAGAWYAFDRLMPVQKITKQIAESVAPGGFSSIKTARQAEAALNFANGNWLVSGKTKAQGGISVQEFVDALRANDGAAALTLYSAEEVKAGIKDKSFTIYQLGKEGGDKGLQVFFGLKRGAPWYRDMIPGVSDNEVEVVSVTNNESGAPGVGIPAIITKAISEGATVLDAFAVKSARFPNGFLPEMYAQFGFEEIGRIPFDPSYYDANGLADLKAFWSRGGWREADGYPDVVVMRWKGNDEDRATAVERYVRSGDTGVSAQVPRYTRAAAGEPDQRGDTSRREKRGSLSGDRGEARGDQGAGDAASVVKRAFGSIQELATLGDGDIRNLGLDPAEVERLRDGLVAIQRSNRLAEPARGPGARPDADDGRTVTGIHYGNSAGLSSLSGAAFGSGIKGAEQARLAEPGVDPRIKKRVYFYLTNGMTDMPRPEIGLGAHVYRASLGNMYDPTRASAADVKRVRDAMKGSGANAFESAVLDAGYRGYVNREQGTAVVLNANVPVAYEGLAQASKMRDRVIQRVVQAPTTRQDGDELVRKPTNDEMMGIIKARPALAKAAPSFRLEFGDARVKAVEVDAANRALEEAGASFQFDDALIDGKIQYSKRTKPAPEKTVTAYKLFRVDERKPGMLFPLFVDANTPVPVGEWLDADIGPAAPGGKVKSKLGPLAFRPGWHAGDLPIATHIGGKSSPDLKAPDIRPANQVWAEIEMAADRDWQTEANKRGTNASGKLVAVKAHITDQLPEDGYYRYKTNPNMTGNWLIGGSMKVTRILSDDEVVAINEAAGTADLPRQEPFDSEKYGFGEIRKSNRAKESWFLGRDELGRIKLGAGAKAYRLVADVANNVLDRVAMKPISTDLSRAIRKMKVEVDQARLLTADAADHLSKLTEDERALISDVIEGELKAGVKPPKRVLEVAASMQGIMSEQTAELVRLGMLSADAAGRWDGKYLPRFYESKLKDEGKAWVKAAKSLLGRPRTMQGIKGSSLKGRGMFQTIPVSELQTWVAQGWEERDPNFDPAVDTEITVWRDYSREEREKMGEIRDAMFRFVMGYTKSQQDIALGRLYEQLANTVASKSEIEGYVQVPSTNVEDTKARRYGKLAGKWVPKEVMDHLSATDSSMQSDVMKFYLKALSMWKEGKTVLNPVSHANNVISNLTVAHFAGVSYWDAHKYIGATRDLVQRSPMVREAEDAGLFGGTMTQAELVDMLPDQLKVLAAKTESKAARGVDAVWNAMSFWLRKPLGKAYEAEDLYFRYLIYRDARQRGLEPDDAVEYAQKYIFTYDDLPKGARAVRNFALPFFSYTYKAIPMLAQTALETPWRYAAPAAAIYTINAIMYAFAAGAGDDDDDWMSIIKRYVTDPDFRAKAKELEQEERKNLPEWMKGASLTLGTSKAVRLGVDEVTDLPVFLDVSRVFPGGDLFDAQNNAGGVPLLAPITPNNPLLTAASALLFNKDSFTGKEVVKRTDTSAEAATKRAEWAWKQFAPAIAVGNYHFDRAMNVVANVTGEPVNLGFKSYTGVGNDGLPIQGKYAAMQTVGIKARPIDLETSAEINKSQREAMIRELDAEIRRTRRLANKGAITSDAEDQLIEQAREKRQRLKEGLTIDGEEK